MQLESQQESIERRLKRYFPAEQSSVLAEVITDAYKDLVKTSDFNELKGIVRDLAEAQKRTEQRVEELAEAQKRTEQRVDTLAVRMEELAGEMRILARGLNETRAEVSGLARGLNDTRAEVGGLARSFGYALENEAYRALPAFLARRHGLEVIERFVRTEIGGEEINLFGKVRRNGQEVLIVGETKLQLDERRANRREEDEVLAQLAHKVAVAQAQMPGMEIVPLLITHYARPAFLQRAREQGVIVAQSFEW